MYLYEEEGIALWSSIKSSLLQQTKFLFVLVAMVMIGLWVLFIYDQKQRQEALDMTRYFSSVSALQPFIFQALPIPKEVLVLFELTPYEEILPTHAKSLLKRGDVTKGFEVLEIGNEKVLRVYNSIGEVILSDKALPRGNEVVHFIFTILLLSQVFVYKRLQKGLKPLALVNEKLKALESGDLSSLDTSSPHEEIYRLIDSYNRSVAQVKQMMEMREMFNKVFMHEMKTPLAKGMFYVKQEPSYESHAKLAHILKGLNDQLDEFLHIERLIVAQHQSDETLNMASDLIEEAMKLFESTEKNAIVISGCKSLLLKGNAELWVLCFKNLIDNGLKYTSDKKLYITCNDQSLIFYNKGNALPIDVSQEGTQWKIDSNIRHKSSTGYGFGLFIIKTIVSINKYFLHYTYDDTTHLVSIQIDAKPYS